MALVGATIAGAQAPVQGRGRMGMGAGMMGMAHDSATMAQMQVIHELVVNNERITRTVTNLPNGIRTVTTSDDPRIAGLVKEHTLTMLERVARGDDPGLPMESPALKAIFVGKDKIRTTTDTTATGIVVVQMSADSAVVAALQQHAAEVTDLVRRGMVAMHEAMMKNMHGGGMMRHDTHPDTSFHAMQERGKQVMGVDQYTSTHHFDAREDGGRIELQRDVDDTVGVAAIRKHLKHIATAFAAGNFSLPGMVHLQEVPGAKVMAARRDVISYTYRDLPRGGEVRIVSKDAAAIVAIHEFLAFQGLEHRAR
ncbi:MAG: hypothetical protein ACRENU_16320 [Gemmatimonadaceae bacterium]